MCAGAEGRCFYKVDRGRRALETTLLVSETLNSWLRKE